MYDNNNEYTAMTLYRLRQQELMRKADQYRLSTVKQEIARRMRRVIRINND